LYRTPELADAAACDYAEHSVELDGHRLKIYKYHPPIESRPMCKNIPTHKNRVMLSYD